MKKTMNTLAAVLAALALGNFLGAAPPNHGSQQVHFTGTEIFTDIGPGYSYFTTQQTISIPSLQVDEYVLVLVMTTTSFDWMGDGYYMSGKGPIMSPDGSEIVGEASFVARTHILEFSELQPWTIDVSIGGAIWDGPLGGLVITEKIFGVGTSNPWFYEAGVDGFFVVPEFMDKKKLKESLRD